jgi:ABC-2 type transport system ATP-binding protein
MDGPSLAIEARGLVRRYRRPLRAGLAPLTAVDGLDLRIATGTVFGLLGPNGAGKTTTIHMLLGLVRPTSGDVRVFGRAAGDPASRSAIGFVPEKFELPGYLTARSFLRLHARLLGMSSHEREREVDRCLDRLSLTARADDIVSTFSKGMQQRLAIAQALLGAPRLVVLDEPTSALDPIGRRDVRDLVLELRESGATVLFNSHLLAEVEQVCDEVAILERGKLVSTHAVGERQQERLVVELGLLGPSDAAIEAARLILSDLLVIDAGVVGDGDDTTTRLRGSVRDRDEVARLTAAIVEAGGRLVALDASGESLESLFMRVVGADAPSPEVSA